MGKSYNEKINNVYFSRNITIEIIKDEMGGICSTQGDEKLIQNIRQRHQQKRKTK
jgi:hypothetical protein